MNYFQKLIALLCLFLPACLGPDGELEYERMARTVYAASGAIRTIAESDPSLEVDQVENLIAVADSLTIVGRALDSAQVIGAEDADLVAQASAALFAVQQLLQQLDPDKYEEWRPYIVSAVAVLGAIEAAGDDVPE